MNSLGENTLTQYYSLICSNAGIWDLLQARSGKQYYLFMGGFVDKEAIRQFAYTERFLFVGLSSDAWAMVVTFPPVFVDKGLISFLFG